MRCFSIDANDYNMERVRDLSAEITRIMHESNTLLRDYEHQIRALEARNISLIDALAKEDTITPKTYEIKLDKEDFEKFKADCCDNKNDTKSCSDCINSKYYTIDYHEDDCSILNNLKNLIGEVIDTLDIEGGATYDYQFEKVLNNMAVILCKYCGKFEEKKDAKIN
jgi:hypothetical protein